MTIVLGRSIDLGKVCTGPQSARVAVGYMAEGLVATLMGARDWTLPGFAIPSRVAEEFDRSPYSAEPDLWCDNDSSLVEVKAGIRRFYVTKRQLRSYTWIRDQGDPAKVWVYRPRVSYAFVHYELGAPVKSFDTIGSLLEATLRSIKYILVLDSRLVEILAKEYGSWDKGSITPLSPLLGDWAPYYRFTPSRLAPWVADPRAEMKSRGLAKKRWHVRDLKRSVSTPVGVLPSVPTLHVYPKRNHRKWEGPLMGETASLGFSDIPF